MEKVLLEAYAPSAVLTDQKGKILYFHGRTGKYLEPAPGDANMNIFEMAREGIRTELSVTMRKALFQKKSVVAECLTLKVNGGSQQIDLSVIPVNENSSADSPLLIVAFKDIALPENPETGGKCKSTRSKTVDKRIAELEKTLQYTKENLQTTIEELETSNEELKSANEELQSTNEELQSANEELETSKEEQQSLNEELITVNAELQNKLDELARANNDMRNLLDSVDVPTVFLDNRLCISRFTLSGSKIANLIRTDIGRPISDIVSNLNYEQLVGDAREVLRTLVYKEHEVQAKDGHWYLLRIMPYRTTENVIEGLVITLSDIHPQKLANQRIGELNRKIEHEREYAESIVNTIRESILVLDRNLKVITANRSFYEIFRISEQGTKGKLISELGAGQWDIPELGNLLENVISQDVPFDDYELGYTFPDTGRKKLLLNARKITHSDDSEDFILLVIAPK
ncbi:MAG: PAS domain-containing protein [Desulfobacteraceae bacterium]|nr:PAS domain-containing protein [Desulfobacteraceae bacterium]